ncbi:hypothetical protein [Streptomyces rimosus]|uniref:hypothetical protein n=1 Tax=Streptomyces rimosus TaxID=1927 RepID=UPI0037D4D65E
MRHPFQEPEPFLGARRVAFTSAVGTRADWGLEPHRDRCGRIDCSTEATAIEEYADCSTRATPYGAPRGGHG